MFDFVKDYNVPLNYDLSVIVLKYSGHVHIGNKSVSWVMFA